MLESVLNLCEVHHLSFLFILERFCICEWRQQFMLWAYLKPEILMQSLVNIAYRNFWSRYAVLLQKKNTQFTELLGKLLFLRVTKPGQISYSGTKRTHKNWPLLKMKSNSSWVNFTHFREKTHLLALEFIFVSSS